MAGVGCNAYTCTSREGLVLSALLGVPPVVEAPWLVRQGDQMQPISFRGNSSWRRPSAVLSVLVPGTAGMGFSFTKEALKPRKPMPCLARMPIHLGGTSSPRRIL